MVHRPSPIQLVIWVMVDQPLRSIDGWIGDKELFGGLNTIDRDAHHT